MPIVYYLGGPADLTKRNHSERLFNHDQMRIPILPALDSLNRPIAKLADTRYNFYRLQQIGTDLFVGIHEKDSQ